MNKEKFKFVNEDKEDFLIEDEKEVKLVSKSEEISEEDSKQLKKKRRKEFIKKYTITSIVMLLISGALFGFALLWQWKTNSLAIANAFTLTTILIFAMGWMLFVYNLNILSPLIHGFKSFGLMIVGKRPKLSYYDYMKKIQDNPLPKFYYLTCFVTAGILLIPTIILIVINT